MNQQKNADYESDNVKDKNKTYLFYDIAVISNNNNHWYHYPDGLEREVTSEYASVSSTNGATLHPSSSSYNTTWGNLLKYNPPIAIEFDVVEATAMQFLIYYNNTTTIAHSDFGLYSGHWKIEIKTDGIYVNEVRKINQVISGTVTVGFQNPNNKLNTSLKYKNFIIYSI